MQIASTPHTFSCWFPGPQASASYLPAPTLLLNKWLTTGRELVSPKWGGSAISRRKICVGEPHFPMWMYLNFKYLFYIHYLFANKKMKWKLAFKTFFLKKSTIITNEGELGGIVIFMQNLFFFSWGKKEDTERLKISTSHQYVCRFNLAFWISLKMYRLAQGFISSPSLRGDKRNEISILSNSLGINYYLP